MLQRSSLSGLCLVLALSGCGQESEVPPAATPAGTSATTEGAAPANGASAGASSTAGPSTTPATTTSAPPPRISLGGNSGSRAADGEGSAAADAAAAPFKREEVLAALQPFQILRDKWNAIRQKSVGGQDAGEEHVWIWDFRTNPKQPALVMNAPQSKYLRHARLTYHPGLRQFQLTVTDPEDHERTLVGDFSEPVQEVQLEGEKLHRIYKLALVEQEPADPKDQWRIVLNQQENNRYLLEMERQRGTSFARFETISAQRDGTSFALSDTDYGDRTCIISGGLGTIQVSFNGKSYWVCCTGCQGAFEEEPARWIAEFEAKQKEMPR